MEELTEVITTAAFHPAQCNLFMYASSKAAIRVGDLRVGAVCDSGAGGGGVRREWLSLCYCGLRSGWRDLSRFSLLPRSFLLFEKKKLIAHTR
jgi:hypothetical protein